MTTGTNADRGSGVGRMVPGSKEECRGGSVCGSLTMSGSEGVVTITGYISAVNGRIFWTGSVKGMCCFGVFGVPGRECFGVEWAKGGAHGVVGREAGRGDVFRVRKCVDTLS